MKCLKLIIYFLGVSVSEREEKRSRSFLQTRITQKHFVNGTRTHNFPPWLIFCLWLGSFSTVSLFHRVWRALLCAVPLHAKLTNIQVPAQLQRCWEYIYYTENDARTSAIGTWSTLSADNLKLKAPCHKRIIIIASRSSRLWQSAGGSQLIYNISTSLRIQMTWRQFMGKQNQIDRETCLVAIALSVTERAGCESVEKSDRQTRFFCRALECRECPEAFLRTKPSTRRRAGEKRGAFESSWRSFVDNTEHCAASWLMT